MSDIGLSIQGYRYMEYFYNGIARCPGGLISRCPRSKKVKNRVFSASMKELKIAGTCGVSIANALDYSAWLLKIAMRYGEFAPM